MSWQAILAIGSGGFIGALLRVYINSLISHRASHEIAYGTLGVNLIGSFIMGIVIAYSIYTTILSPHIKSFLSSGLLGAMTTYSAFAIESFFLFKGGHIYFLFLNIIFNSIGTIVMAGVGFYLVRWIMRV